MFRSCAATLLVLGLAMAAVAADQPEKKPSRSDEPTPRLPAEAAPNWIWLGNKAREKQVVFFRKEIIIKGSLTSAKVYATCDDAMTLYVNGKPIADHTGWESPFYKDITDLFVSPSNLSGAGRYVIAVRARNQGSSAGLLVKLVFDSGYARPFAFVSDSSWRAAEKAGKGFQDPAFDDSGWKPATVVGKLGEKPWQAVTAQTLAQASKLREPPATPIEALKVARDFKVELLHSVPKDSQGSWVSMCVDPKGRLIVSDQYGSLYRVTPPALGAKSGITKVEKLNLDIGEAQGLLWAFDSLYVMVNRGEKYPSGLYRVPASRDHELTGPVELLRKLEGVGEHGPHAIIPAPDGQSLYVACGNGTRMTELSGSRVPRCWGEDHLLPRMPDGRGFMKGVLGPGGCIYRIDRDGKNWELTSTGYRNEYDIAFNRHGDLFTYDSDMEWDINTPWYRPTRVCLAASGSDFGWRNGAGKWPPYYPDSLPAVLNIGPGSPTGVTFGYGAKFPAKYQEAFYICDWSYGKLYAVHLTPEGSSYKAESEEFITGSPLPLTDLVINPADGAMYFAIGGRRTKSGLYRVTYAGKDSTEPSRSDSRNADLRALRRKLESFHGRQDLQAAATVWPYLGHEDRFIRSAARVALEHQDPSGWRDRALAEKQPQASLAAMLALVRVSSSDPFHRAMDAPPADGKLKAQIVAALDRLTWDALTDGQRLELLRVLGLVCNRMGPLDPPHRQRMIAKLAGHFPSRNREINVELCQLLVYLEAPGVAARALALMAAAPTQEEQMDYARALRVLKSGWTLAERKEYFAWFHRAAHYKGGASFGGFVANIKNDALATLTEKELAALQPILEVKIDSPLPMFVKPRPVVKTWKLEDLAPLVDKGLTKRDFDRGRALFGQATCFTCHRFDNEGGAHGPDLTGAAGRFSTRDLLESIIEPNKVISDQYNAVVITTSDGKVITGRIVNLAGDAVSVMTNMLDPGSLTQIDRKRIESMEPSRVSMMPESLLNTFQEDEILDLMAYLLSRGDRNHAMFRSKESRR